MGQGNSDERIRLACVTVGIWKVRGGMCREKKVHTLWRE
jgi:hypothetical protein